MKKNELIRLISTGEGYTLEFKENISESIGREICAFANSNGGKILLGVADDGRIIGRKLSNREKSQITDIARNMEPPFQVFVSEVDNVAVIQVPDGNEKPYSVNGAFYLRVGPNSQRMNRSEIIRLFQNLNLIRFDEKPNINFDLKRDFYLLGFKRYTKQANITKNASNMDVLRNLSVLDGNNLKNAGVLVFCRHITKFFPNAMVTCVLYEGTSKNKILDKKEFNADILSNFDNAFIYICSKLNTGYFIGKERTENLELPEEAIREALMNAIAHRDYNSAGHIQIDIFLDRVDISNPGGLVAGLSKSDFGRRSLPRNPLLMDLMLRIQKVERVGSGIRRIQSSMRKYQLAVRFNISENFFSVVLKRKRQKIIDESTRKVPEKYQKILDELIAKPSISRTELAKKLNEEPTTIQSKLRKLVKGGLIRRIGPDKGGHWKIARKKFRH